MQGLTTGISWQTKDIFQDFGPLVISIIGYIWNQTFDKMN